MAHEFLTIASIHGFAWKEPDSERFPSSLHRWLSEPIDLDDSGTHFVFVAAGRATLHYLDTDFTLHAGMYAAVPGACQIAGGSGISVTRLDYQGLFSLGGPLEEKGRLRYIDGCTDTLLISPIRWGDPCLNLLHIPAHTHQSQHTHPSHRVGVIVSGHGHCITPNQRIPLTPGQVFVIPADSQHSFHTQDEVLRVVAYHPESDFGPSDETHPMVNRTILTKP